MNKSPVVFIHIPKTAGTSLRKIIVMNYDPKELYFVYDRHPDYNSIKDLKNLDPESLNQYKVIMGHFPFNRRIFPLKNMRFATIVRDPIERVISYYHHILTHNDEWRGRKTSLSKYLETSGDLQLQNHQTRVLSGVNDNLVSENHVMQAIKNINEDFIHVGISEKFDESVSYLCNLLSWRIKEMPHENVSVNRPDTTSFSITELNKIREINQFDIKLYEYVKNNLC